MTRKEIEKQAEPIIKALDEYTRSICKSALPLTAQAELLTLPLHKINKVIDSSRKVYKATDNVGKTQRALAKELDEWKQTQIDFDK